jgi:hypothetical protein
MDGLHDGAPAAPATSGNMGATTPDAGVAGGGAAGRGRMALPFPAREWWRKRNVLGVHNWELALIAAVAGVAGIVATIGSSLIGVR